MKINDLIQEEIAKIQSNLILEQVESILEEFSYEDYYESYDEIAHNVLQDFLYKNNEDYTKNIPWTLVPFQLLKSTWEDWVKLNGVVRYPQNVEKIENKLYRNIMMISVITEMCGHKQAGQYYMSEENEELNEVVDGYLNNKTQEPVDTSQLEMDFDKGGGVGNPTPDTNYYVSDWEKPLFAFLDRVYEEKGLEDYSPQDAKKELLDVLLEKWYWKYSIDPKSGHNYISDYGLEPLEKLLVKLVDEEDVNRKIPIIDQILNVAHQRSDLAAWLVQGGSAALSQLSGYGELEPEETVNEELLGKYANQWESSGDPVEIYKNPNSIKRMNPNIRGLIDTDGNVYVADVDRNENFGATTHHDMISFLRDKGLTQHNSFLSNDYTVVQLIPIIRQGGTNRFSITSEVGMIAGLEYADKQVNDILQRGMNKNPSLILTREVV